ncbi:hypothetical protein ABWH96_14530 [Marivirga tractuosa]|uniref:hypothetical protein n=1 Tax=Marivirga tractuosa TaxID=1006 RepID=UPI0035CE8E95
MKKALNNLRQNARLGEELEINTTHLYIRFLPSDTIQTIQLEDDSALVLFDHPLLYDIEVMGQWYHDPELEDQAFTWLYTVVPVDYEFPAIEYEVLDELFMMDGENDDTQNRMLYDIWDALEYEALKITNNLDEESKANGRSASKWNPSGRIQVEERTGFGTGVDRGDVPVRYCKVRARKLLKWGSANTSVTDGRFRISKSFRGEVNYSIEVETAGHKVTDWKGFSINLNGPKRKGAWNRNIPFGNESVAWNSTTILNAIYHFRTQASRHRLKLPGVLVTAKIRPVLRSGRSNALGVARHIPISPTFNVLRNDVKIYTRFDNGNRLLTDDLYEVTMHELAHVSHFLKSPTNAILSIGIEGESWATAVEYYFTLPYYPAQVNGLIDEDRTGIECCGDDSWKYTPYFIDLIDNSNQRNDNNGNLDFADDDVEGYTLEQIQDALDRRTTLSGVATHLRNNYVNSTESRLTAVTSFYNDIREDN